MAAFLITRTCDLKKPLRVEALETALFTGDENAHELEIAVQDGGEAVALSGHVYGYFIRSDGMTVDHEGTISGNKVSVILPASAYYHEGYLDIAINVDTGNEVLTVYAARAFVYRTTSNNYAEIDPTIPIPSLLEILQKIQDCENATVAANTAAESLEGMDATATGLATGTPPTATVSTVDGHYRIAFGIPAGATGATGATPNMTIGTVETLQEGSQATATITGTAEAPVLNLGIPVGATGATGQTGATGETGASGTDGANAIISNTAVAYQVSSSGTTVPSGTWVDTIPTVPQGSYLWIRTLLTWNNGAQTILYSISRNGVDGSGSVASVNGFSPDGNGNVDVPLDTIPTAQSDLGITSDAVYTALQGKQNTLTFDQLPASASTNPVTSGGIYSALTYKVDKAGDTMTGVLKIPNPEIYDTNYPQLRFKETANTNPDALVYFDRSQGARRFSFKQLASASDSYGEVYALPPTTGTFSADVSVDIMTSKGGTMTGTLLASTMKVYDASYPMFVLQSSAADTSALGAVYENIANRQLVLRQRSTQGYIEDYYLPVNSATSANQSYEILTGKDGVLAYKDQTVSVSLSANTWTEMTVTQQVAPAGYTPLTRTIADGSTTAIRGYLFLIPNNMGNTAHILLYATQAVSGTFTLRTWFVKTSAAKAQ